MFDAKDFIGYALSRIETMENTHYTSKYCLDNNINGDFVECGVYAGAQCGIMLRAMQDANSYRKVHLFDSFEGIPIAGENDDQQPGIGVVPREQMTGELKSSGVSEYSLERVTENLIKWTSENIVNKYCKFYKGWFQNTISKQRIRKIALLRLDGDLYESTKVCVDYLMKKVVSGGIVIIDDYALTGCKKAIDEYLKKNNIKVEIVPVVGGGGPVWFKMP